MSLYCNLQYRFCVKFTEITIGYTAEKVASRDSKSSLLKKIRLFLNIGRVLICRLFHFRRIKRKIVFAIALDMIERFIRLLKQCVVGVPGGYAKSDADTDPQRKLLLLPDTNGRKPFHKGSHGAAEPGFRSAIVQECDKLIASNSADDIGLAKLRVQRLPDQLYRFVALRVAQRIIESFKAIQVYYKEGTGAASARESLLK